MASVFEMDKVDLKVIQNLYQQRVEHRHTDNPEMVKKLKKKKFKNSSTQKLSDCLNARMKQNSKIEVTKIQASVPATPIISARPAAESRKGRAHSLNPVIEEEYVRELTGEFHQFSDHDKSSNEEMKLNEP